VTTRYSYYYYSYHPLTHLTLPTHRYYGPFTGVYRDQLVSQWVEGMHEAEIPCSPEYSLEATLGDPVETKEWQNYSLPTDAVSTCNGILVTRAKRWPLCIDPQGQANRWLRKLEEESGGYSATTMADPNLLRALEGCVRVGQPLLVEDVREVIEPALEPILQRAVVKQGGRMVIRIGDSDVDYDEGFKFYMTSKMANPHYSPETCIKVTIVNFTVTFDGLEEQLLGDAVKLERPDIEERNTTLLLRMAADKKQLATIESTILRMLSESTGNILDDADLINTLGDSKVRGTVAAAAAAAAATPACYCC